MVAKVQNVFPELDYVFDTIGSVESSSAAAASLNTQSGLLCTVRPGKSNTERVPAHVTIKDVFVFTAFPKPHTYRGSTHWPVCAFLILHPSRTCASAGELHRLITIQRSSQRIMVSVSNYTTKSPSFFPKAWLPCPVSERSDVLVQRQCWRRCDSIVPEGYLQKNCTSRFETCRSFSSGDTRVSQGNKRRYNVMYVMSESRDSYSFSIKQGPRRNCTSCTTCRCYRSIVH